MKKNVLALSIAAMIGGFAGAASAEVIVGTGPTLKIDKANSVMTTSTAAKFDQSEGGAGHILLVPYFTTQNDNMSVIHVVNTDTAGKALKVRFRGAANSDDILDFQVFLSPGDVWTGSVQSNEKGSFFRTTDGSCTVPDIRNQDVQFVTDRLASGWAADKIASNTKEGYVEIFNIANIPADKIYGSNSNANSELYTTIKHVGGKAPCDATVLNKTLDLTGEANLANYGFDTPSGGLTGDWYILNVAQTTTFSGAATAIKAVDAAGASARGNYVLFPQDAVAVGSADGISADPLLISKPANAKNTIIEGPLVTPVNYDFPDLTTPYLGAIGGNDGSGVNAAKQAFALTTAVARGAAINQYATDPIVKAKTDWVFSMPTRRYSVGANYAVATTADAYRVFNLGVNSVGTAKGGAQSLLAVGATAVKGDAPNFFNGSNTNVDADGNICVSSKGTSFSDREEAVQASGPVISPGKTSKISFCGEVSVLSFKDSGDSVLGAKVARANVDSGVYENGWGTINTTTTGTNVVGAIPLMGASFIKLTNSGGLANNFSGTYGITWPHRFGN